MFLYLYKLKGVIMVDSINSTNLIQQVKTQQVPKPEAKPALQPAQNEAPQQTEVASSVASAASMAYAAPQVNTFKAPSFEDYVAKLNKEGKIEGKDYKIEKDEEYTDVIEFNKDNNKESKVNVWKNVDGKLEYMGSEEYSYQGDKKICTDGRNANGKLEFHTHHYYNDEVPQATISHDGLTCQTKVEDYINNLKAKGVKFTEQTEENKYSTDHIVEEYDANGKQTMKTVWVTNKEKPEYNCVYRDLLRSDGTVGTSVVYNKDRTNVVNLFN
jgi:hypothetical protein